MNRHLVLKGLSKTTGLAPVGNSLELKGLASEISHATGSASIAPAVTEVRLIETPLATVQRKTHADLPFYGRFQRHNGCNRPRRRIHPLFRVQAIRTQPARPGMRRRKLRRLVRISGSGNGWRQRRSGRCCSPSTRSHSSPAHTTLNSSTSARGDYQVMIAGSYPTSRFDCASPRRS